MSTKYLSKLHNKRVLVIGGTSGIGYAVAEAVVEYGANVTVASSKQANVDKSVESLKKAYPDAAKRIHGHVCDLSSDNVESTITTLLDFATNNNTTKLDHIVHTAGDTIGPIQLDTFQPSDINKMTKTRLVGAIMIAKLALPYLNASYTSSITLTGGVNTYKPMAGWAVLSSIGGAKDSLTRGLAKDIAPIRVNLISPGAIRTPLLERFAGGNLDAMIESFGKHSLLKRVGEPDEVAETYLSVMKNYFQTGTVVHAEGGYLLV